MHPILFQYGPFVLYTYGLFTAVAFVTAFFLVRQQAPAAGLPLEMVTDLLFILFMAGIIGARVFYVLQHLGDYVPNFSRIFMIQEGGLVWYGGFLTAAVAGVLYAAARKWPVLKLADFLVPYVALAQGVGRMGCFLNGCCFGKAAPGLPWAAHFPGEMIGRHPVQLYEAGALFVLFAWLLSFQKRKDQTAGLGLARYILAYSALRFALEFLRGDQQVLEGLTPPQWTSVFLFTGAVFFYRRLRQKPWRPDGRI